LLYISKFGDSLYTVINNQILGKISGLGLP
jgi:hypothetical protein